MRFWVVTYDVTDDKRRHKVSQALEGYGRRVQYSVFECELDDTKCSRLELHLRRLIDETEDDIRFYPLNRADLKDVRLLGKAKLERAQDYYVV